MSSIFHPQVPTGTPESLSHLGMSNSRSASLYTIGSVVGEGTFGKVKIGFHNPTGERVAVKVLEKSRISEPADVQRVSREIHLLKRVNHPNILHLLEVIDTGEQILLITQYCSKGELFNYIVEHQRLKEREACRLFHQILDGVDFLHELNIIHRDLKPENVLLEEQHGELSAVIIDFGLSNTNEGGKLLKTACGSPCYAPPEMIANKPYSGEATDIWSLGVMLFAMSCGYLPFEDPNTSNLYKKIINARYKAPAFLSPHLRDIIKRILEVNPDKRLTSEGIRRHPWFTQLTTPPVKPDNISDLPADVNRHVLSLMSEMGMNADDTVGSLYLNEHNQFSTTYYLLLKREQRMGRIPETVPSRGSRVSTPATQITGLDVSAKFSVDGSGDMSELMQRLKDPMNLRSSTPRPITLMSVKDKSGGNTPMRFYIRDTGTPSTMSKLYPWTSRDSHSFNDSGLLTTGSRNGRLMTSGKEPFASSKKMEEPKTDDKGVESTDASLNIQKLAVQEARMGTIMNESPCLATISAALEHAVNGVEGVTVERESASTADHTTAPPNSTHSETSMDKTDETVSRNGTIIPGILLPRDDTEQSLGSAGASPSRLLQNIISGDQIKHPASPVVYLDNSEPDLIGLVDDEQPDGTRAKPVEEVRGTSDHNPDIHGEPTSENAANGEHKVANGGSTVDSSDGVKDSQIPDLGLLRIPDSQADADHDNSLFSRSNSSCADDSEGSPDDGLSTRSVVGSNPATARVSCDEGEGLRTPVALDISSKELALNISSKELYLERSDTPDQPNSPVHAKHVVDGAMDQDSKPGSYRPPPVSLSRKRNIKPKVAEVEAETEASDDKSITRPSTEANHAGTISKTEDTSLENRDIQHFATNSVESSGETEDVVEPHQDVCELGDDQGEKHLQVGSADYASSSAEDIITIPIIPIEVSNSDDESSLAFVLRDFHRSEPMNEGSSPSNDDEGLDSSHHESGSGDDDMDGDASEDDAKPHTSIPNMPEIAPPQSIGSTSTNFPVLQQPQKGTHHVVVVKSKPIPAIKAGALLKLYRSNNAKDPRKSPSKSPMSSRFPSISSDDESNPRGVITERNVPNFGITASGMSEDEKPKSSRNKPPVPAKISRPLSSLGHARHMKTLTTQPPCDPSPQTSPDLDANPTYDSISPEPPRKAAPMPSPLTFNRIGAIYNSKTPRGANKGRPIKKYGGGNKPDDCGGMPLMIE